MWRSLFTMDRGLRSKMADIKIDSCYSKELLERNLDVAITGMYVVHITFVYILPSHFIRL